MKNPPPVPSLAELAAQARTQRAFPLVQSGAYRLRAVQCDAPFLVLPLAGRKRVHLREGAQDCPTGSFAFWQQPCRLDVENVPDPDGDYRALVIPFAWTVVEGARALLDRHQALALSRALIGIGRIEGVAAALSALFGCSADDAIEREHRQQGLLLALARAGHDAFRSIRPPSLAERIRSKIAAEPARAWTSALLEAELALSGATLRRHLADEGCSLREARLHHALNLMQTSDKPLKAIAQAAGYRSTTQFALRFTERFGVSPSAVLNRAI